MSATEYGLSKLNIRFFLYLDAAPLSSLGVELAATAAADGEEIQGRCSYPCGSSAWQKIPARMGCECLGDHMESCRSRSVRTGTDPEAFDSPVGK